MHDESPKNATNPSRNMRFSLAKKEEEEEESIFYAAFQNDERTTRASTLSPAA